MPELAHIGTFVGFTCCIWLRSRGHLGMGNPDWSRAHFCPLACVRVPTDPARITVKHQKHTNENDTLWADHLAGCVLEKATEQAQMQ